MFQIWTLGFFHLAPIVPEPMNILRCCVGGGCVCFICFLAVKIPQAYLVYFLLSLRISHLSKENGSFIAEWY